MSRRYNEFRQELLEGHTTLTEAAAHARKLRAEISRLSKGDIVPNRISLRLHYAREELRATDDHIRDIKRQIESDCEHLDIDQDERCCLDCGADLTEELMARAYDRAKDARKYGN